MASDRQMRIDKLEKQQAQIKAKLQREKGLIATEKRKAETQVKILIGAALTPKDQERLNKAINKRYGQKPAQEKKTAEQSTKEPENA